MNDAPKITAQGNRTCNTDGGIKDESSVSERETFSKQLSECVSINERKQRSTRLDSQDISSETEEDISMCCDSGIVELLNGIVGILEGFELLDNQLTDDTSKMQAAMAAVLESTGQSEKTVQNVGTTANVAVESNGLAEEGNTKLPEVLSEQFARMLQDSQPVNLPHKARQEITKKVGEYFSSLESTNNEKQPQSSKVTDIASLDANQLDALVLKAKTVIKKESASDMESGQEKMTQFVKNVPVKETAQNGQAFEIKASFGDADKSVGTMKEAQTTSTFVKDNVVRIVDKMTAQAENGRQEFDIQLKPDFLGKLNIKLTMENGEMKMLIKTEELAVKGMFSDQLPAMQDALKEKGIMISNIDVVYDDKSFLNGQQQAFKQRGGNDGNKRKWQSRQKTANAAGDSIFYGAAMETPDLGLSGSSMEFHA